VDGENEEDGGEGERHLTNESPSDDLQEIERDTCVELSHDLEQGKETPNTLPT
jgi:hypothetical protein